jgi:glucokinase
MHVIAADVGGTKTRLAFADSEEPRNVLYETRYLSSEFDGFEPMLHTFIKESGLTDTSFDSSRVDILTLALPGLVSDSSARLTNLPWTIEKQSLKNTFGIKNVYFMNDFQASAFGTDQLLEEDRVILNPGVVDSDVLKKNSTRVAVGAGTGLGVAWAEGATETEQLYTHDSEGGHIDFAPTDDTQIQLLQLFVQVYGAYIGNIALMFKPYGGIYITGGIAAKILNKMQSENFIEAYLNKGRMRALVEQIAVYLVTNERVGVLGAMSEAIKLQQATE